jgi:hypothetical protein
VFIAGINFPGGLAVPVFVDGTGRLGSGISSARYKDDIHDMGDASDKLMKLRPSPSTTKLTQPTLSSTD